MDSANLQITLPAAPGAPKNVSPRDGPSHASDLPIAAYREQLITSIRKYNLLIVVGKKFTVWKGFSIPLMCS
jgi:hypothetical protein